MSDYDKPGTLTLTFIDGNVSVWPVGPTSNWGTSEVGVTLSYTSGWFVFHPWHQVQHLEFTPELSASDLLSA